MGKKNKRKKASKYKIKIFVSLIIFGSITLSLGYNLFNNIMSIFDMNKEKMSFLKEKKELEKEKEILETDINKLENQDYIAKYVREKYFYSKEGELILRIDD